MRENYENCLAITLKWEGGDVNHPADPGGKTRWGITQGTYDEWRRKKGYRKQSVFQMTKNEMLAIYKANYWDAVKGDTLAFGVDLATWDYGVNSGPSRARKALLKVAGGSHVTTVKRLCASRMSLVRGLSTWRVFGKGWSRRIADIEARAVKMAASNASSTKVILQGEARRAEEKAKDQKSVGKTTTIAGGGSGGAGAVSYEWDQVVSSVLMIGLAAGLVALGVYLVWKSRHNKERAKAYRRVAEEPTQ